MVIDVGLSVVRLSVVGCQLSVVSSCWLLIDYRWFSLRRIYTFMGFVFPSFFVNSLGRWAFCRVGFFLLLVRAVRREL